MTWIDAWVLACVATLPLTENAVAAVRALLTDRDGNAAGRIDRLQIERADLERKLSTLGDMLLADPTPVVRHMFDGKSAEIAERLSTIEVDLAALLSPVRAVSAAITPIEGWLHQAGTVRAVLHAGTTQERADMVAGAITHIVFRGKEDPLIIWQPWAEALIAATGITLPPIKRVFGRPGRMKTPEYW